MGWVLPKSGLRHFLSAISERPKTELVAPLEREGDDNGTVEFASVTLKKDLDRLNLSVNPQFPAKRFFMPAYEQLYTYDRTKQKIVAGPAKNELPAGTQVLFGLRLCDLNAVKIQDALMLREPHPDSHYKAHRDKTILIGWYCNEAPSQWCFCGSMQLTNYYDLMVRERRDTKGNVSSYYVDAGNKRGEEFMKSTVRKLKKKIKTITERDEKIPPIVTTKKLDTHDIARFYDHPKWKQVVESECLSCERCTTLCPTCMCFDTYDKVTDDLAYGKKERSWDSCHNIDFTRVAGNHYFRPSREARFKHRIYHKLVYYPAIFNTPMCTGCGRCIEHCPTRIDFVESINEMNKGH